MNKAKHEQTLAAISRRFRALRGWDARRRNKREEQIDRWRVVKHPLSSCRDY